MALMRTADDARRFMGAGIAQAGITLQQYNVLRILRGAGGEALPTLEIGERMVERTPGTTRLLDRLERRELVERHRCTADRRRVLCTITRKGLDLLSELDPVIEKLDRVALGGLDEDELTVLLQMLARVRSALAAPQETNG